MVERSPKRPAAFVLSAAAANEGSVKCHVEDVLKGVFERSVGAHAGLLPHLAHFYFPVWHSRITDSAQRKEASMPYIDLSIVAQVKKINLLVHLQEQALRSLASGGRCGRQQPARRDRGRG